MTIKDWSFANALHILLLHLRIGIHSNPFSLFFHTVLRWILGSGCRCLFGRVPRGPDSYPSYFGSKGTYKNRSYSSFYLVELHPGVIQLKYSSR